MIIIGSLRRYQWVSAVLSVLLIAFICSGCLENSGLRIVSPKKAALIVEEGETQSFIVSTVPEASDDLVWYLNGDVVQNGGEQYAYLSSTDNFIQQHRLLVALEQGSNPANVEWRIADNIDAMPSAEQNPHIPTAPGPWFEGWYTRLSDHTTGRSMAVIVASHLPKGEFYQIGKDYPGYINVLINEGDGAPTKSFTVFPEKSRTLINNQYVSSNPDPLSAPNFRWEAPGVGYITESHIELTLPGEVSIKIDTNTRIPFNKNDTNAVPEGPIANIDLPLRWYIHSLGSSASYEYQLLAEGISLENGTGFAHQEKNWGTQFPIGWIWGQGINNDNSSQFVASRALVDFKLFVLDAWIIAFRNESIAWDFRFDMQGIKLVDNIDACNAEATMEVIHYGKRLVLEFSAPPDSFGDVSIPTENGFQPASGGESFVADVNIKAYENGVLIAEEFYTNAALELGASFYCNY